jgi:hypothetical protein
MVGASAAVLGVAAFCRASAVCHPNQPLFLLLPHVLAAFSSLSGLSHGDDFILPSIYRPFRQVLGNAGVWPGTVDAKVIGKPVPISDADLNSVPSECLRLEVESLTEEAIRAETDLVLDKYPAWASTN